MCVSRLHCFPAAQYGAGPALGAVPVFGYSTKAQTLLGLRFVPSLARAAQAARSLMGTLSPGDAPFEGKSCRQNSHNHKTSFFLHKKMPLNYPQIPVIKKESILQNLAILFWGWICKLFSYDPHVSSPNSHAWISIIYIRLPLGCSLRGVLIVIKLNLTHQQNFCACSRQALC